MLLFYLDEHGDSSMRTDPDDPAKLASDVSPYFTLSAVGIRDSSRRPLAEALFETKHRHFGDSIDASPWSHSEIKGRHLRRTARSVAAGRINESPAHYSAIRNDRQISHMIDDIALLIAKFRPLVFSVVIDKQLLLTKRADAYHNALGVAYGLIHERIALALEKLYAGESAIIIADEQKQHERYFRDGHMNAMRALIASHLRVRPNFDLVIDKPLWIDTALSSWDREILQLADIVAYSSATCAEVGKAPDERHYLWDEIKRSMAVHWRTGTIQQAGFTVFPPNSYPET